MIEITKKAFVLIVHKSTWRKMYPNYIKHESKDSQSNTTKLKY